jgi:small subunit ribosomal protein S10e
VPNLQVIKLMQSFKSKEYVKEIFSWQYYYYYLTNEGIEYLREYLNLGPDVVPDTLKKSARPAGERPGADAGRGGGRGGFGGRGDRGGREGYRSERPAFGRGG